MPQATNDHMVVMATRTNLYEKFRRMQAPEFEELYDPYVADERLSNLQVSWF